MTSPPQDHFDRAKPFYPLISVYTTALHGFVQLAVRGVLDIAHERCGSPTVDQLLDTISTGEPDLDQGLRKLREPLSLLAACDGAGITSPVDRTAREIAENHHAILPSLMPAFGSILLLAHEIVKQQLPGIHDPILEFLRHVRNGVAHNGRWHFEGNEPRRPAVWRPFTLQASMHGEQVFRDAPGNGLLGPGDPIRLLWDIEQQYPSLHYHASPAGAPL